MKSKLNIGILINNQIIDNWQYKTIEKIVDSEFSRIVLIIKTGNEISTTYKLNSIILNLHKKVEKLMFKRKNNYDERIDLTSILKDLTQFTISPLRHKDQFLFIDEDILNIKRYDLDVIISFDRRKLGGDILKVPKFGIWTYDHYDNRVITTCTPGYWESVLKRPETGSVLKIMNEENEDGIAIYRTWGYTYTDSIESNRNKLFWTSSILVPRVLKGLYFYGEEYFERLRKKFNDDKKYYDPIYFKDPSTLVLTGYLLRFLFKYIKTKCENIFFRKHWFLLVKKEIPLNIMNPSFSSFREILPPKDRFWADPFIIAKNNRYFVFIEEYVFRLKKAHISVLELDNNGKIISQGKVIDKPYHLSYPFVFDFSNCLYMVPETSKNNTIELYKCISFPYGWDFVMNLMENISASDTTLFYYNERWWLFTSIDESGNLPGNGDELFLFFSDDLFTNKWISHPENPIVSDTKTARGAGKIFIHENKIYRPSQDCSGFYGRAFNINEITLLNEYEYKETLHTKVTPDWDSKILGTHTFNFEDNIIVIDAFFNRRRI